MSSHYFHTPTKTVTRRGRGHNKLAVTAKHAIEHVFSGLGGVEGMLKWAQRNKTAFYSHIYPKLLPRDMRENIGSNRIQVVILPPNSPSTPLHIDIDPPTSEIQVSDDAK